MENGCAFFYECTRRFFVVIGHAAPSMVPGFEIENIGESAGFRRIKVLFHIAKSDLWAVGYLFCKLVCYSFQIFIGGNSVDDSQFKGALCVKQSRGEVEFSGFGSADQASQKVTSPKIT